MRYVNTNKSYEVWVTVVRHPVCDITSKKAADLVDFELHDRTGVHFSKFRRSVVFVNMLLTHPLSCRTRHLLLCTSSICTIPNCRDHELEQVTPASYALYCCHHVFHLGPLVVSESVLDLASR